MGKPSEDGHADEPLRPEDDTLVGVAIQYLDGVLSDQDAKRLEQLLLESSHKRRVVAQLAYERELLMEVTQPLAVERETLIEAANDDPDVLRHVIDHALELRRLQEREDKANRLFEMGLADQASSKVPHSDPHMTFSQLYQLAGYLAMKAVRTKGAAVSAIAAILLLGVLLFVQFSEPTQSPDRSDITAPDITPANAVATLTAERDAAWDRRPGDDLYAGQQFTLTQGFAEITTSRGAIAVLEAPCTFVALGGNRIALTWGTLIGHCPTVASRGFTVDTPTAQIVDIGTRFGVAVDHSGETALEVFTGEVSAAPVIGGRVEPAVSVVSGQAARIDGGEVVVAPAPVESRFASGIAFERSRLISDPSVIAYYGFDQPSSGVLRESHGAALFDAEIVGARWTKGHRPGTHALDFSGKAWEERVVLGQEASDRLKLQGDFTIAMWVNIRDLPQVSGWSAIATKGNDSWRILGNRNKKTDKPQIGFYWSQSNDNPTMNYKGVVTRDIGLGRWHHVVVTGRSDGEGQGVSIRLYLDGVLKAEQPFPHTNDSNSLVTFGASSAEQAAQVFDGMLGEVAFFDRAIPEDKVRDLYNAGSQP